MFAGVLAATDYHVGPGQAYTQLGQVPWYALQAGDTVYIHYQSAPYREKILISGQGTASQWIRVLGVPGPNGELPIISGDGATTSKNNHYRWQDPALVQYQGVIQIAVRADDAGRTPPLPSYIEVANLQVQDAYQTYSFTAENGATSRYDSFAACIYAKSPKHLLIRNNVLTNCGQGFYNWTGDGSSGGSAWYDGVATDVVLRGNYFYNNGNPNSYTEHQTYTESDGVTIEYNRYGKQRSGALGSQLKDRSAGTVIRYNYIEQSPAGWDIDLVEPEESYAAIGRKTTYSQAFVYGNAIVNQGVREPNLIHWNEDHQMSRGRATLANGRLYFYDNTVVTIANRSDMTSFSIFNVTWGGYDCQAPTPGVIDVRNNIFAVIPRTPGSAVPTQQFGYCGLENFNFGKNWVSPGWTVNGASSAGTANLVSPSNNDPGFVNAAGGDVHLAPGASAAGIAGALAPEVTSNSLGLNLTPTQQYVYHTQVASRTSLSDAGAFSAGGSGCSYTVSPTSGAYGAAESGGSISIAAGAGCAWSASTNDGWLSITSGNNGSGYGVVTFTVAANTSSAARTGTLSVAGTTVTISQAAAACGYSLSSTNASVAAGGGSGSVNVTGASGCSWTAVSGAPQWITVTGGANGSGSGSVSYSVAANSGSSARTGTITIAGRTFTITQAGVSCSYSLSGAGASVPAAGGTGVIAVTSGSGCGWTAASSAGWITAAANGSGSGSVNYSVAPNTGTAARVGTITVAGQTFTISQAGVTAACSYAINPVYFNAPAAGTSLSITVTAPGGCAWTAASSQNWITVASGASGSGNGSVTLTVSPAPSGTSTRTGKLTVAGAVVVVSQSAAPASAPIAGSISFRQGANNYVGALERTISSLYAGESWNGGKGVTDPDGSQVLEFKNDSEYEARPILRFSNLSIPAGRTVTSATLTLSLESWLRVSPDITGYYMASSWNGMSTSTVNWKFRDNNMPWTQPGASAIGTDVLAGKSFVITGIKGTGRQTVTVALDPAVVQSWISNPASNQGLILTISRQGSTGHMSAYSSANSSMQPVLTLNYQ